MLNCEEELALIKSSMAAARMAYVAGDFNQCARQYNKTVELAEHDGFDGEIIAEAFIHLSICQSAKRDYQEAERLLNKALNILQSDPQCDQILLAHNYHELSVLYWRTGREAQSREMNDKALSALNGAPPNVAELKVMVLKHKAVLLTASQQYSEASKTLEAAIDIALRSSYMGKNSLAYGQLLVTKVLWCIDTKKFDEARELYNQAIQIVEMYWGPHHPKVADLYDIFADHLKGADKEEAAEYFRKKSKELHDWIKRSYKW